MNRIVFSRAASDAPPRVLVVADDPLTRAGLTALLRDQGAVQSVGQLVSAEAVGQWSVFDPAVLLWEVGSDPASAFERIAALDDSSDPAGIPRDPPPVVALLSDEAHAAGVWLAGARGIFLRTARLSHVIAGVIAVAQGIVSLDPLLARRLIAPRETLPDPNAPPGDWPAVSLTLSVPLTAREREVLQWLGRGLANKAIAQRLTISESTVKFHVNAILAKLGAQSRTDAVIRATRLGLVSV